MSILTEEFEPVIPASEQLKIHTLDLPSAGIGQQN